jgi:hypothetical protein
LPRIRQAMECASMASGLRGRPGDFQWQPGSPAAEPGGGVI